MSDAITLDTIVRLRDDHRVIGLVREVDGDRGMVAVVSGRPGREVGYWIPRCDLEPVPWEELGNVPFVLVA